MSCCGKKRNQYVGDLSSNHLAINHSPVKIWDDVFFEYTGETGLTVKGGISRNIYRFNKPGDVQLVDYRDASGMMAIPVLKKAR